jgi:hypothetical protein
MIWNQLCEIESGYNPSRHWSVCKKIAKPEQVSWQLLFLKCLCPIQRDKTHSTAILAISAF